jgi:hypothetical protein
MGSCELDCSSHILAFSTLTLKSISPFCDRYDINSFLFIDVLTTNSI